MRRTPFIKKERKHDETGELSSYAITKILYNEPSLAQC